MRGQPRDPDADPRPMCYACLRPKSQCLCSAIAPFEAHCNFLVLQHPHERRKYHSTAKLVTNAISNSKLIRGIIFDRDKLEGSLNGQKIYLLYPGAQSTDCSAVQLDRSSTVIVLDGTWVEARKIVYRNPFLKNYLRISFKTQLESQYHIRKQPKTGYLSTLESIAYLLKLNAQAQSLETETERYDELLKLFEKMVSQQMNYFPRNAKKLT